MSLKVGEICDCKCHESELMHIVSCCFECPCCEERISFNTDNYSFYGEERTKFMKDHIESCPKKNDLKDNDYYLKKMGLIIGDKYAKEHRPTVIRITENKKD